MTREEIINEIKGIFLELGNGEYAVSYLTQNDVGWLNETVKALEKQSTDSVKVKKALERIKSLGLKDEIRTTDDVLDEMKDYTLFELANTFSEIGNLLYDLRDLLESDEVAE